MTQHVIESDAKHPHIARLKQKAEHISRKGNMTKALQILDEAEQQALALDDPLAMALVWRGRANVYMQNSHAEMSLEAANQAVAIYQEHGTLFMVALAQTVSVSSLNMLERYEESIALAEQIRPHFLDFPLGLIKLNSLLALTFDSLGQYEKAFALYEEVNAFYLEKGNQGEIGRMLLNMGVVAQKMDNLPLAYDLYHQAYPHYAAEDHFIGIIKVKSNLAKLCIRQNRLQDALKYLIESRQAIRKIPDSPDVGRLDLFEGRVRRLLNQPEQAESLLREAHTRFEAAGWKTEAAEALIELAHVLAVGNDRDDLAQALAYLQQAEDYFETVQLPLLVALAQLEEAELLLRLGRLNEAVANAQTAQAAFAEAGLALRQAQTEAVLGDCLWRGNGRLAQASYQSALNLAGETAPLLAARCWHGLGRLAWAANDVEAAEIAYTTSVRLLDKVRTGLTQHQAQATFLEDKQTLAEEMLHGLHRKPEKHHHQIFKWAEKIQGRSLADLLQDQPPDLNINQKTQTLLTAREKLAQKIDQRWQAFTLQNGADLSLMGMRKATAVAHEHNEQQQLTRLNAELQTLDEQIRSEQNPAQAWRRGTMASLTAVQAALDDHSLLVSYYSAGNQLYAFTTSNQPAEVQVVPLGICASDIEKAWKQSRRIILRPSSSIQQGQKRLAQFWRWLIEPISQQIAQKKRLIIIPYKGLFHVPFACLYDESSARYLVEQVAVQSAPSATIWHHCISKKPLGDHPLLVGFPGEIESLSYLDWVTSEIASLNNILPNAKVLLGDSAQHTTVLEAAKESYLLHLAGHIFYDQANPLASGMPLADGRWLRASDLYLRYGQLSGDIVVLSGCESGRIQPQGGEVLGLTSAFLYAGASCLIASMWPVDDASTAVLMQHFYHNLTAGLPVDEALQTAQMTLMQHAKLAHPFYWAPFSLMGASPDFTLPSHSH